MIWERRQGGVSRVGVEWGSEKVCYHHDGYWGGGGALNVEEPEAEDGGFGVGGRVCVKAIFRGA